MKTIPNPTADNSPYPGGESVAQPGSNPSSGAAALRRYVPLAVWITVILTILFISLKILAYGYLPPDDALRHAGKAVSGKPWNEILVTQDRFSLDHNPGWHVILSALHRNAGWGTDSLAAFSVVALFLLFSWSPLPWLRRPEAWLTALLIFAIFAPGVLGRMSLGRPFLLTMAVLLVLLLLWTRRDTVSLPLLVISSLLVALSVWIHGSWYLLSLPVAALFLCAQWRKGWALTGCWLVGTFLGAILTGHPFQFIYQAVDILLSCFGNHVLERTLVTEFRPSDGNFPVLVLVALLLLWRQARGEWKTEVVFNPIFILAALGWFLGLRVVRFWEDWGQPAIMLWVALELQYLLRRSMLKDSMERLGFTVLVAAATYTAAVSDRGGRWTWNLTIEYLSTQNEDIADWLPDPGGIIYSSEMQVFYRTFFRNPTAPWRYILGFESTFMPEEDLSIHRNIQWNFGASKSYGPWVERMRSEDRLIISAGSGARPNIDALEWHYAATGTWIGRLPRAELEIPADPLPEPK